MLNPVALCYPTGRILSETQIDTFLRLLFLNKVKCWEQMLEN